MQSKICRFVLRLIYHAFQSQITSGLWVLEEALLESLVLIYELNQRPLFLPSRNTEWTQQNHINALHNRLPNHVASLLKQHILNTYARRQTALKPIVVQQPIKIDSWSMIALRDQTRLSKAIYIYIYTHTHAWVLSCPQRATLEISSAGKFTTWFKEIKLSSKFQHYMVAHEKLINSLKLLPRRGRFLFCFEATSLFCLCNRKLK